MCFKVIASQTAFVGVGLDSKTHTVTCDDLINVFGGTAIVVLPSAGTFKSMYLKLYFLIALHQETNEILPNHQFTFLLTYVAITTRLSGFGLP